VLRVLGSAKRWLIDKLFAADRLALYERLDRIENVVRSDSAAQQHRLEAEQRAAEQRLQAAVLETRESMIARLAASEQALGERLTQQFTEQLTRQLAELLASSGQRAAAGEQALIQRLGAVEQGQIAALQGVQMQLGVVHQLQLNADARIEAIGRQTDSALEGIAAQKLQARRMRAEHVLWSQIGQLPDLRLSGPMRNVLFLHNSYYHFFYLAKELRRRGWRALSVSFEDPNGANANYYHGEDLNLHDPDPLQQIANIEALYEFAKDHFDLLHFAGDGIMSFFPSNYALPDPPDIVEWKKLGKRVAYTISGCKSATAQTSVRAWSRQANGRGMCDNCPWENRPEVCSDAGNLEWAAKVHKYCDLVFSELQPSLDGLSSRHPNVVRGPVSMVLDPELWRPDLEIPAAFRLEREPGEVLVYHAFGNYDVRGTEGRNIKGTPAIHQAVERLRAEGFPVRLMFFSSVPNEIVRFYQAQADIVVDQLWAGSWGANGRESLMLGKPVVGFVNTYEHDPADVLEALTTTPVVNATVDTIYDVLRGLVQDPQRRADLGRRSREYALAWHAAAAGAARYELAYDAMLRRSIRIGLPAETPVP
jgi:glycosyltransferase involved in cell wall biosynthesis